MAEQMRFHIRRFTWEDLPELVALANVAGEHDGDDERFTETSLREELEAFNVPEDDLVLAEMPGGQLAGYAYVERRIGPQRLWGFGWGAVHPRYRRQGIGRALLRAAEGDFFDWIADQPVGNKAVFIQRFLSDRNPGAIALAEAEGYAELRASYRMHTDLDQPVEPGRLPDGFVLRAFDRARHLRAVYEVDQTAFMDGGGQDNKMLLDEWEKHFLDASGYDPALWLVAWQGEQVAGVCIVQPWGDDHPDLAWIGRLGVLREHRGQGLGAALLRSGLRAAQDHGYRRAALGVRGDVPGAIRIYQRAGMQIYTRFVHYRKVLRGNPAEIVS